MRRLLDRIKGGFFFWGGGGRRKLGDILDSPFDVLIPRYDSHKKNSLRNINWTSFLPPLFFLCVLLRFEFSIRVHHRRRVYYKLTPISPLSDEQQPILFSVPDRVMISHK